jgi:hypothetical protein
MILRCMMALELSLSPVFFLVFPFSCQLFLKQKVEDSLRILIIQRPKHTKKPLFQGKK